MAASSGNFVNFRKSSKDVMTFDDPELQSILTNENNTVILQESLYDRSSNTAKADLEKKDDDESVMVKPNEIDYALSENLILLTYREEFSKVIEMLPEIIDSIDINYHLSKRNINNRQTPVDVRVLISVWLMQLLIGVHILLLFVGGTFCHSLDVGSSSRFCCFI